VTSTPPRRPSAADSALLGFAQEAELAARDLYRAAAAAGSGGDQNASIATLAAHHDAASQAISALIGRDAPQSRLDSVFDAFESRFTGDTGDLALAAHELENTMVATHLSLLEALDGTDGVALVSSVVIAEARHVSAMAALAGLSPVADIEAYLDIPASITPLSPEN
jgi:hypothetical protein